jgi:serine phosphatase RsbU (regulator of sigma subunit)
MWLPVIFTGWRKRWLEKKNDKLLFAAADCTGHGVPGSLVSVICNNGLNRSVREHGLTDPGTILDKTREIIISEFEKSDEEVKDGMDISLVSLKTIYEESGPVTQLEWAGANNPLWLIRQGKAEIEELKPDKQPIGKYAHAKPFTTHQTDLVRGDLIYLFTDGYQDQFGGEKGKKFKAAQLKELLLSIAHLPMDEQKEKLESALVNWIGSFEQVDDICMMGVRIH